MMLSPTPSISLYMCCVCKDLHEGSVRLREIALAPALALGGALGVRGAADLSRRRACWRLALARLHHVLASSEGLQAAGPFRAAPWAKRTCLAEPPPPPSPHRRAAQPSPRRNPRRSMYLSLTSPFFSVIVGSRATAGNQGGGSKGQPARAPLQLLPEPIDYVRVRVALLVTRAVAAAAPGWRLTGRRVGSSSAPSAKNVPRRLRAPRDARLPRISASMIDI